MELIPESSLLSSVTADDSQPSFTYFIDFENNVVDGMCNDIKAIMQSVYKILNTERYKYVIYDRSYGVELRDLIGKPSVYVSAIIKGRIEEALLWDKRIKAVENFEIVKNTDSITVEFSVVTEAGNVKTVKSFVI